MVEAQGVSISVKNKTQSRLFQYCFIFKASWFIQNRVLYLYGSAFDACRCLFICSLFL